MENNPNLFVDGIMIAFSLHIELPSYNCKFRKATLPEPSHRWLIIGVYVSGGLRGEESCCSFFEVSIDLDAVIFIKMRFVVFGIHHFEICVNDELFYNGHRYTPIVLLSIITNTGLCTLYQVVFNFRRTWLDIFSA